MRILHLRKDVPPAGLDSSAVSPDYSAITIVLPAVSPAWCRHVLLLLPHFLNVYAPTGGAGGINFLLSVNL